MKRIHYVLIACCLFIASACEDANTPDTGLDLMQHEDAILYGTVSDDASTIALFHKCDLSTR